MQNDLFSSSVGGGDPLRSTMDQSLPYPYLEQQQQQPLSSSLYLPSNAGDLFYSYNSPFSPPSSLSLSPSPLSTNGDDDHPSATENRLYLARLALQYQGIADRYERCLSHLQEATEEAETLRKENARLRMANGELTSRLAMSSNKQVSLLTNELNRMAIGSEKVPETSPTSVLPSVLPLQPLTENQLLRQAAERRAVLPKSISIRSSGYLKMNQPAPTGPASQLTEQIRGTSPVQPVTQQKVLVGLGANGVEKGTEAPAVLKEVSEDISSGLEVEVYNQGMFKTELCNKWEEKGECPYGEHCQFAHGISELRPVLRHPRYKTELCRMVLSGESCPYGHRCHFRHTLSPSERLLLKP